MRAKKQGAVAPQKSKKLTAHAISLKIAEYLEPADSVKPARCRRSFCGDLPYWIHVGCDDYYVSHRGCWIVIHKSYGVYEKAPRDFTADSEMLWLLLKRREFVSLDQLEKNEWGACFCKSQVHSVACSEFSTVIDRLPERAVALAFIGARNL